MFLSRNRTGHNYLVSWRASLFFHKMDKQGILESMIFPGPPECRLQTEWGAGQVLTRAYCGFSLPEEVKPFMRIG